MEFFCSCEGDAADFFRGRHIFYNYQVLKKNLALQPHFLKSIVVVVVEELFVVVIVFSVVRC
jgi:hypothetical protein